MPATAPKELVNLRVPRQICDEARAIAAREDETVSSIYRRLLRRGLQVERKAGNHTVDGQASS